MTQEVMSRLTDDQAAAVAKLSLAAERGDGDAACQLGDMYRTATGGVRYSPRAAFRWYVRSALTGDASGQNNLEACFEHGIGSAQSYAKAVTWYRQAAAQKLAYASSNLGYLYLKGQGVPADRAVAVVWFEKALEQGDERAAEMVKELGG